MFFPAALIVALCSPAQAAFGANTAKTSSGVHATELSATPLKLGYIEEAVSLGAGSSNALTIPAFQAWVRYTNAHGGVNGHPIQLLVEREPDNPGIALADVEQLVKQGIVGLLEDDPDGGAAWASYVQQAGIPVFSTTSPNIDLAVKNVDFSVNPYLALDPKVLMTAAAHVGSKTMAVLYCGESADCSQAVPALKGAGTPLGVNLAFSTSILGSSPNYIPQCLAAKQANATSLFVADASQIILRVAAACAQQGYTPHEIMTGSNVQQNMATAPGMNGAVVADGTRPFFDTSYGPIKAMTAAFNKYDPGLTKNPAYGDLSTAEWDTGLLIAAAAKAGNVGTSNPMTPAALLAGIYTLHSTNLGGMTPTLTFVKGTPTENKCWFWVQIAKNKFAIPSGVTPACLAK